MGETEREWVSMREAARQVGITVTTIRDWSKSGTIETRERSTGRQVDIAQVKEKAMGPGATKRPSSLQDRVADGEAEQGPDGHSNEDGSLKDGFLASTLQGLHELARKRHP